LVWGIIVGIGAGGVGSVLTATVGNRWFVARRGLALGILGSASSTGQIIFLPLFMAMITYAGWRQGSMALIIVAVILLPLIFLFMRDDPSEVGLEPYGAGDPNAAKAGGEAFAARHAGEACHDHRAGSCHQPNLLAALQQLLCLRRNRQRFDRHASDSA
jgi:sugar phosphate permease